MPTNRSIFAALLGIALGSTACGGGGGDNDPTGPPAANVVGHYSITHTGTLAGLETPFVCPGDLDITNQTGNAFSGTISITATEECQGIAGSGNVSGTVTSGGAIDFTISISNLEDILETIGCNIVGGDPTFTGLLLGLGLTRLSMAPQWIVAMGQVLATLDTRLWRDLVREALHAPSAERIRLMVQELLGTA